VILGTGQVDIATALATLEESGYRGWISLEPVDERAGRTELAAAVAYLAAL
jgi:sugar phosphate isomerase/epimerase